MTFHNDGVGCDRWEPYSEAAHLREFERTLKLIRLARREASPRPPGPQPAREPTPRMRRLARVAAKAAQASLLVALLAVRLSAQDWNPVRSAVDQFGPWEVRGPRVGIQAARALGTAEAFRLLRSLRVPPNVAAPATALSLAVVPHIVGVARGAYPFHAADWLADAVIGGGAAYLARALDGRHRRTALLRYLAAWAAVWPLAEP